MEKAKALFLTSQPSLNNLELTPWEMQILSCVDYVPCNIRKSSGIATLMILEDNDAVIKLICKGRSATMRHIARTHRVDLDWLIERIREDPGSAPQTLAIRMAKTRHVSFRNNFV